MLDLSLGRSLRLAAERNPAAVALRFQQQVITHGELAAWSNRIAHALLKTGLRKGDLLGVMLGNSPLYVALACAAAKAGIGLVLLNYRFTGDELTYHLRDSQARAIVFDIAFEAAVSQAGRALPELQMIPSRPAAGFDADIDSLAADRPTHEPEVEIKEGDLLVLQYTSGTTGRPKGAIITHRNRSLAFLHWPIIFGFGSDDILLHCGPFYHSAPFGMALCQLCLGGQVVIMPAFNAADALTLIERERVTWAFMVPAMYNAIFNHLRAQPSDVDLSSLRRLLSGASPLPTPVKQEILRAFPNAGLFEFYGATEVGTATTLRPEDQWRKTRCVGRPVFGAEVKIVDAEGSPVAAGTVGEIYVKTPSIFDGYRGAPEKTAAAFRDGWCTLGDLGRMDEEGYLYIVDRLKDVIKSGGVNIYPSEIEEVLLTHPDVAEAAVIGIPHPHWGEAAHAVVVTRSGTPLPLGTVAAHCQERLAGYKVPKSVETRDALPHNPAGKILKRTLREDYWRGSDVKV
jgi:acyl-CoA synthetase (AMP-forming)/AMP-acid ligase II